MSTVNPIYRLRHLLLGVMLAFALAFLGAAATLAEPMPPLGCEEGDLHCADPSAPESLLAAAIYLPIVNNGSGGDDMIAVTDDALAVTDDTLAVTDDVIAVPDDVVAVTDDEIAVTDDVVAVTDDVIALTDDTMLCVLEPDGSPVN